MSDNPAAKEPIQVFSRMMRLIEALSDGTPAKSLKELAEATQLHPSTAHRILNALQEERLIDRREHGYYQLGLRLIELGNIVKSRLSVRELAIAPMQRLHLQTDESVNLGVLDGAEIVYVERTSSGRSSIRVVHIVGARAPLHTTASGKLFLAEASAAQLHSYVERTGLAPNTSFSITDTSVLQRHLQQIRHDGIARDIDEAEVGIRCLAAGIRNSDNQLVAAISLSTPSERFQESNIEPLRQTAAEISAALGFRQAR